MGEDLEEDKRSNAVYKVRGVQCNQVQLILELGPAPGPALVANVAPCIQIGFITTENVLLPRHAFPWQKCIHRP